MFYINDSFEMLIEWSRQHEEYEIDEWILLIPVIAFASILIVIRNLIHFKTLNLKLNHQFHERENAEKKLLAFNEKLELKVHNQTDYLKKTNRSQAILIKCIKAVIQAKDEINVLNDFCNIIVKEGGYKLAWVGYALDDKNKTVKTMAQCGFDDHYIENAKIVWDDNERGIGPVGKAIREKKVTICRNVQSDPQFSLWCEDAIKRGYASIIALPLFVSEHCIGSITIYSPQANAFDREETELLIDLSNNLSFGIANLAVQSKLIDSERKYRSLFENSNDGIVLHDIKGAIIDINDKTEQILGYKKHEIVGNSIQSFHPKTEKENSKQAFEQTIKKGYATFETQFKTKDGSFVYASVNSKIYDKAAGLVQGTIRDISEQKKLQSQLNQKKKMESIGKLAGGIAHEFNNILSIIIGNNELVMEELSERNLSRESAEEIRIAAMRARDVVKQLLTFSRQDNTVKKVIDLRSVVKESMKLIRSSTPANIKIQQMLSDNVYPILGNETQMSMGMRK